jgi:hypothetical protein
MDHSFKPNSLKKTWWKFTDKKKYKLYKLQYAQHDTVDKLKNFASGSKLLTPDKILEIFERKKELNFTHSGNAGDVMYALPVIKQLSEMTGSRLNLLLKINEPMHLSPGFEHPLGNVMINQQMADGIMALLNTQTYVKCAVYNGEEVDVDLSAFRETGFHLNKGNIARWNFHTTGVFTDLAKPWLAVEPDTTFADTIVIARSSRYNNPFIDYSFLAKYNNLAFVGVESEYLAMKKMVPHIKWVTVENFLQMAKIIAGSKFFIGNQSFPYSIAEALKARRLLEAYFEAPNVIPEGANGYDFFFQKHFEYLVEHYNTTGFY